MTGVESGTELSRARGATLKSALRTKFQEIPLGGYCCHARRQMPLQLVITRFLLPAVIFLGLAATAVHFLFLNGISQSRVNEKLDPICFSPFEVSSSPLRLAYTGYEEVDKTLCGVCIASIAFLFAEAARDQRPLFMAMPAVFGVLMQTLSFGLIMPLYSLLFVIAGAGIKSRSGSRFKINQANAEALLFAVLVGYIVPQVCMVLFEDAIVTAIWQIFPIFMGVLGFAHRLIRSPSRHIESGHYTVQATFALVFVGSAVVHILYVWPLFNETATLQRLFLPYTGPDDPAAYPLIDNIAGFFKWDFSLGVVSTFALFLWFADDLLQCIVIAVWCIATTIVLGPGAAISSVLMWREEKLNGFDRTAKQKAH
ncbi:hypothetical protein EDD15DRAFT_2521969 [Pisolithus albus]|nr:hypothetical protein EDD15DRAFT_2521969 [Pisolithus albus]